MLKITQIKCPPGEKLSVEHIARKLNCRPDEIRSFEIERESIDARRDELFFTYSVLADLRNEEPYLQIGRAHV